MTPKNKIVSGSSPLDNIKQEFAVDIGRARQRINELITLIPTLEKEKEQLIGMVTVMKRVLEDGADEPKDNGHEPDGAKKRDDGSK